MRDRLTRLVAAALVATVALLPAGSGAASPNRQRGGTTVATTLHELASVVRTAEASRQFLAEYVDPDGRVVRHDQGGDTVSEGQAYGMLVAVAVGAEDTFRRIWRWTARELRRDDGLFAWRWQDGAVVGHDPAADADLLIAGALAMAARRFDDPGFAEAARTTSDAVLLHETQRIGAHSVLLAGPWAMDAGVFNPSYAVLPVMSILWEDGAREWGAIAASSRLLLDELTHSAPHLPPDWAVVAAGAHGRLTVTPSGEPPVYGWDAARVPVQLAADCDPRGRRIAARMWPFFLSRDVVVAAVHDLDGTVRDHTAHPAAIVGAAGAAAAAGADDAVDVLLQRAADADREHATYYGAAWIALGRLWLTTGWLGGCGHHDRR